MKNLYIFKTIRRRETLLTILEISKDRLHFFIKSSWRKNASIQRKKRQNTFFRHFSEKNHIFKTTRRRETSLTILEISKDRLHFFIKSSWRKNASIQQKKRQTLFFAIFPKKFIFSKLQGVQRHFRPFWKSQKIDYIFS